MSHVFFASAHLDVGQSIEIDGVIDFISTDSRFETVMEEVFI